MIYLIDDDISVKRAFEFFLESAELKYKAFESTDTFIALANPSSNDLIVLSVSLPGISVCNHLKKIYLADFHIPIIVITTHDDAQSLACCKRYGVIECLRKPVDGEALVDLIKYNLPMEISRK
jgi:FixJ family two-component response regulator